MSLSALILWATVALAVGPIPGRVIELGPNEGLVLESPDGQRTEFYVAPGRYWLPDGWEARPVDFEAIGLGVPAWEEAAHLAVLFDRACDRASPSRPLKEEEIRRVVTYARWQAREEGFEVRDWPLRRVEVKDLGEEANRIAGRYLPREQAVEISIRFLEGWDWADRPAWGVFYHEAVHAAGILEEETAQLGMLEMLAGSANEGKREAADALVCELRSIFIGYLRYMAAAPTRFARDQAAAVLGTWQKAPVERPDWLAWMNGLLRAAYRTEMQAKLRRLEALVYDRPEEEMHRERRERQIPMHYTELELLRIRTLYAAIPACYVWRLWEDGLHEVELVGMTFSRRAFRLDDLLRFLIREFGAPAYWLSR